MELNKYGGLFAEVYNLYWTEFVDNIAPQIISIYKTREKKNSSQYVLDLCCGTGRLSQHLLKAGLSVVGLDLSAEMINVAKRRNIDAIDLGTANFYVDDAVSFKSDIKFGMVVSSFDSLNHLQNMDDLTLCFTQVYNVLEEDGLFIFDLNTEKGLKNWEFVDLDATEKTVFIVQGIYDRKKKQAYSKVYGFLRMENGLYKRFEETMNNSVFKINEVKSKLEKIGFQNIFFTKDDVLTTLVTEPEKEDRIFIFAEK